LGVLKEELGKGTGSFREEKKRKKDREEKEAFILL